jgi:hypothetical protein
MSNQKKHTPTPWVVNGFGGDFNLIARMDGHGVAISATAPLGEELEDARFIVLAVNSHEALVEALERLMEDYEAISGDGFGCCGDLPPAYVKARSALSLAKGGGDAHGHAGQREER